MEETEHSRISLCAEYENGKNLEEKFLDSRIIVFVNQVHSECLYLFINRLKNWGWEV